MKMISNEIIEAYRKYLISEEKAPATIEKYIRDIGAFARWLGEKEWDKEAVLQYKSYLCGRASPASVNSVISSLNRFFAYGGRPELKVRALKVQRQVFSKEERELSKAEYEKLLKAAKGKNNERLYLCVLENFGNYDKKHLVRYLLLAEFHLIHPQKCSLPIKHYHNLKLCIFLIVSFHNHGVVLAVCSKNDYSDVINVFCKNQNMVLKEENIAIFCVNWGKKSDGIKYISNTLKIDLEQTVFIDDSLFELLEVSTNLPNLQVIHFEQKTIYDDISCLNLKQSYDRESIRYRTQTYQTNAQRSELQKNTNSNDEFLFRLGTVVEIKSSDPNDYSRIAELSQRVNRCTNGKRYTLKALQSNVTGGNFNLYSVYVTDKFSNLGLVGAIGVKNEQLVFIALSCRALDRKVENEMINFIKDKYEICKVDFVCTQKNINFFNLLVKEFGETKICNQAEILNIG